MRSKRAASSRRLRQERRERVAVRLGEQVRSRDASGRYRRERDVEDRLNPYVRPPTLPKGVGEAARAGPESLDGLGERDEITPDDLERRVQILQRRVEIA